MIEARIELKARINIQNEICLILKLKNLWINYTLKKTSFDCRIEKCREFDFEKYYFRFCIEVRIRQNNYREKRLKLDLEYDLNKN